LIALDASALLAFLFREPGHEIVAGRIEDSCLSSVNLAEVLSRFARDGHDPHRVLARLRETAIEIVPLLADDAAMIAVLYPATHGLGLSLGDRACLALAMQRDIPALTADRTWTETGLPVEVCLIRGQAGA
jgi:PIN domain nuclease of toxin-antitoxin system